jgi:hypothetical protein
MWRLFDRGDLVKFHTALRTYKLLSEEHTKLVTTGKVDAGGPIGRYGYGFSDNGYPADFPSQPTPAVSPSEARWQK